MAEGTGIGVFVVRMFWHWRRYGAASMLINDEDPDNMQRHDSVKPVGCCFLCILIDPSLLFNMTAAPRATIRPCLCYLLFCAPHVTVPCYSLFIEMFPFLLRDRRRSLYMRCVCRSGGLRLAQTSIWGKCLNLKVTLKEIYETGLFCLHSNECRLAVSGIGLVDVQIWSGLIDLLLGANISLAFLLHPRYRGVCYWDMTIDLARWNNYQNKGFDLWSVSLSRRRAGGWS